MERRLLEHMIRFLIDPLSSMGERALNRCQGKKRRVTVLGRERQPQGTKHLLTMRDIQSCWHRTDC